MQVEAFFAGSLCRGLGKRTDSIEMSAAFDRDFWRITVHHRAIGGFLGVPEETEVFVTPKAITVYKEIPK